MEEKSQKSWCALGVCPHCHGIVSLVKLDTQRMILSAVRGPQASEDAVRVLKNEAERYPVKRQA